MSKDKELLKNMIVALANGNNTVAETNIRQYILMKSSQILSENLGGNNMNQNPNQNSNQNVENPFQNTPRVLIFKEYDNEHLSYVGPGRYVNDYIMEQYEDGGNIKFTPAESGIGTRFDVYETIDDPNSADEFGGYVFDCDQLARQFPDEVGGAGLLMELTHEGFVKVDPSTVSREDLRDLRSIARRPYSVRTSNFMILFKKVV